MADGGDTCDYCGHGVWLHDHGGFCNGCSADPITTYERNCYWGDLEAQSLAAADADGEGLEGAQPAGGRDVSAGGAAAHADGGGRRPDERDDAAREPDAAGLGVDWREYTAAIRQHELMIGRPAPAPTIVGARGGPKLSPLFTEWLMGLPAGHITGVPGLSVNDQLRLCGNGVVTQQAIAAYRYLLPHLFADRPGWWVA